MTRFGFLFAVLCMTYLVNAKPQNATEELETFSSFVVGRTMGLNVEASNAVPKESDESCGRQIADQISSKLRSAGFLAEGQLLKQIANDNLRQKICRIYASESDSLSNCATLKNNYSPILQILSATCSVFKKDIEQNAECLSDISVNLEKQCIMACKDQVAELNKDESFVYGSVGDVCNVGICTVRCVNAQVSECEEPSLNKYFEQINKDQMVLGLQTAHGLEDVRRIVKSGKLPLKCQLFVQNFDSEVNNSKTQISILESVKQGDVKIL